MFFHRVDISFHLRHIVSFDFQSKLSLLMLWSLKKLMHPDIFNFLIKLISWYYLHYPFCERVLIKHYLHSLDDFEQVLTTLLIRHVSWVFLILIATCAYVCTFSGIVMLLHRFVFITFDCNKIYERKPKATEILFM